MKKALWGLILFILLLSNITTLRTSGAVSFEVSNLQVSSDTISIGDSCVATIDLRNTGKEDGFYSLNLTLKKLQSMEPEEVIQQVMSVEAETTINVSFLISPKELGSYQVIVEDQTVIIEVVEPTEPSITNISPSSGRQGEALTVEILGSRLSGVSTIEFSQGESQLQVESFTENTHEQVKAQIRIPEFALPGPYNIKIITSEGTTTMTWAFTVQETAKYEFSNLQVAPSSVEPNGEVNVSVEVINTGDVAGNQSVAIQIDGVNSSFESVILEPGEIKQLAFKVNVSDPGEYLLTIGNEEQMITVSEEPVNMNDVTTEDSESYLLIYGVFAGFILLLLITYKKYIRI